MKSLNNDIMALRHSAAHLLAHAIKELYPDTILTIGPATEEGFFYDTLPARNFKEEDLPLIEARMKEIADRNLPLTHEMMSKEEARKLYKNNPFKLELIRWEIISEISEKTGISKTDVQASVEALFTVVKDNMSKGTNIYVRGFGSFVVKKRAKKVARNISKNTAIVIDEHYVPSFKPAKEFVAKVKKSVKKV